jgi:plastocyanin
MEGAALMTRFRLILAAGAAAALVVVAPLGAAPTATKLTATVGPGFTISLTKGGKKVSKLTAGAYTITVSDKSGAHNFHLKGPGVNKKTSVSAKGSQTWKVTLKKGKYTYVCDPHASFMKGSFQVG